MAIDSAVSQTPVEAWDKRWATSEGRADWLEGHPAVVAILPELHARAARRVLDLGCGVGRHALLLAEHGFDVEAIDGSLAGLAVVRETAASRGLPVSLHQGLADQPWRRVAVAGLVSQIASCYTDDKYLCIGRRFR